jgi:hypothetical protein
MSTQKTKNQSKGRSKTKGAANSTPPKRSPAPRGTGTPGVARRMTRGASGSARAGRGENGGDTGGRALSEIRRGSRRRGSQSR